MYSIRIFKLIIYTMIISTAIVINSCGKEHIKKVDPDSLYNKSLKASSSNTKPGIDSLKNLSLSKAIKLGLENNPDIAVAKKRIKSAYEDISKYQADYYPKATVNFTARRTFISPSTQTYGLNIDPYSTYSPSFNITWKIFDGLLRESQIAMARYQSKKTEALYDNAKVLLIYSIKTAFQNIILAKEKSKTLKSNVDFYNQLYEQAVKLKNFGKGSKLAVLNSSLNYENAKTNYKSNQMEIEIYKVALAKLLGYDDGSLPSGTKIIAEKLEDDKYFKKPDEKYYIDYAFAHKPSIKQHQFSINVAEENVDVASSTYMPSLSLNGSYGYTKRDSLKFNENDRSLYAGLSVDFPLFDGFKRESSIDKSQYEFEIAKEELRTEKLTTKTDIITSCTNIKKTQMQIKLYEKTLKIAKENRELTYKEYKAGSTSITTLNEAQKELISAEFNLIQHYIQLHLDWAKLEYDAGILKKD